MRIVRNYDVAYFTSRYQPSLCEHTDKTLRCGHDHSARIVFSLVFWNIEKESEV